MKRNQTLLIHIAFAEYQSCRLSVDTGFIKRFEPSQHKFDKFIPA